jgi:hypothetical protein
MDTNETTWTQRWTTERGMNHTENERAETAEQAQAQTQSAHPGWTPRCPARPAHPNATASWNAPPARHNGRN